jgi:hypothetical protein
VKTCAFIGIPENDLATSPADSANGKRDRRCAAKQETAKALRAAMLDLRARTSSARLDFRARTSSARLDFRARTSSARLDFRWKRFLRASSSSAGSEPWKFLSF